MRLALEGNKSCLLHTIWWISDTDKENLKPQYITSNKETMKQVEGQADGDLHHVVLKLRNDASQRCSDMHTTVT